VKHLLSILFVTITFSSSAQVFKTGGIAGLNASQVDGDNYGGYKKVGFILGGYVNTSLTEKWSTQFEIYYTTKGSQKNARPDKGDYKALKISLSYIEVPLALRYHYKEFIFEAGLFYGVLLNSKMSNEFGELPLVNYPFKKYDVGGFFGINYKVTERIIANIRSKNSLLPIRDFEDLDKNIGIFNKIFNRGWYNVEINFSVRYQFGE
jgi:Outer membrane protein beta-barrel domain